MSEAPFEHLYQEELYMIPPRTVVVIDRPWNEITDEDRTLLAKILGSVKLGLANVQIISGTQFLMNEIAAMEPERLIAFGASVKDVSRLYELTTTSGIPVICADSLPALDDGRKKNLWLALRQMFKI
jgi:hypothetical protein